VHDVHVRQVSDNEPIYTPRGRESPGSRRTRRRTDGLTGVCGMRLNFPPAIIFQTRARPTAGRQRSLPLSSARRLGTAGHVTVTSGRPRLAARRPREVESPRCPTLLADSCQHSKSSPRRMTPRPDRRGRHSDDVACTSLDKSKSTSARSSEPIWIVFIGATVAKFIPDHVTISTATGNGYRARLSGPC